MSGKDRQRYTSETVLDQEFLDWSQDNLECKLEMVCEIESPTGWIYASDRNKYVGGTFYEALLNFPTIGRTVGEWLAPNIEFSTVTLELSNVDGRFNPILPGGASYDSLIGNSVVVKIGLAEEAATYKEIFRGKITDVGGVKRSVRSITIIARDDYDRLSVNFPNAALSKDVYPDLQDNAVGLLLPVIYGDFTTSLGNKPAIVPAYPTNGTVTAPTNIECVISENALSFFDNTKVYVLRSDIYNLVPSSEIVDVTVNNNGFSIKQTSGTSWIDDGDGGTEEYTFDDSDEIFVQVKGKSLSGYDDNLVWQARDILLSYSDLTSGEFDANWTTFRDKATPTQSNIAAIKSRVWTNEPIPVIEYVLSMLEQVRLEAFISSDQKLKLNSLHFEDWLPDPDFYIRNWDVVKGSFVPSASDRNVFNRAQGFYDRHPDLGETYFKTSVYKNTASITQLGKEISKKVTFPNLYDATQVENQLIEVLRLASSGFEIVDLSATWRSILQDIGNFAKIDVKIGSTIFDEVPSMIREVGFNPQGIQTVLRFWCFMLCPFPGYEPGYNGTVGGYNATITKEV